MQDEDQPKHNNPIIFRLLPEETDSRFVSAVDSEQLSKQTQNYARVLEKFIAVYYKVRGITPEQGALTLQIPDWETYTSDDNNLLSDLSELLSPDSRYPDSSDRTQDVGTLLTEEEKAAMPTFADIGGQPQAVEEARKLVQSIKHADLYAKRGVDRPKGILMKGPPGTGKTLVAKAIAREAEAEFMSLSVTDLVSKYYGEAEQNVQRFFDTVRNLTDLGKDVIVFIDELDSVVPKREGSHEATQKMIAVLLQNLDGLKSNARLTVLAATNDSENVDPAFLRPGRLDKVINVELPNGEGRAQILAIHLQKHMQKAQDPESMLSPELNVPEVARQLGEMSGADIAAIVNLALEEKTTAELKLLEGEEGGHPWTPLTNDDLLRVKNKYFQAKGQKIPSGWFRD